jgi:DNA-binding NtrC family response regulator
MGQDPAWTPALSPLFIVGLICAVFGWGMMYVSSRIERRRKERKALDHHRLGDMTNIRTAMNRGAFDFLIKPIDLLDLETTIAKTTDISRFCGRRRSNSQRRQAAAERAHATLSRYFSPIWRHSLPAMSTRLI